MRAGAMVMLGTLLVAVAAPARAEHTAAGPLASGAESAAAPSTEHSVDVRLRLGRDGFRLESRVFGPDGYAGGAWLNGAMRRNGFSLDGRVEHDGTARNFRFNADVDDWMWRILDWRGGALDL